jgi:hypothetical protein
VRNPNTLFIVGAGASAEAEMPTGKGLIDIIARRLDYVLENKSLKAGTGDPDILDIFQQRYHTREEIKRFFEAAWHIRDGIIYAKSIDSFLDGHRDDKDIQLCGKLAIVKSILEAEQQSHLYIEEGSGQFRDLPKLKETWFFDFAKNLNDGVPKSEIERIFEKVTFVIFNYDRCFEHFMFHALKNLYGVDDAVAARVMRRLKIVHPYGSIGEMPWQSPEGIPFGFRANRANMEFMAKRVRTYTEQIEEGETLAALKQAVVEADTLVFLGFSYHPENMNLLSLEAPGATERVFGTAKGISEPDTDIIKDQIRKMVGGKSLNVPGRGPESERLFVNDVTAAKLLQDYSRSLFISGRARA